MELKLIKIETEKNNECLVFEILEDCNLWPFIICDTDSVLKEGNTSRHSFFFPSQNVNVRDYVLLFSKSGTNQNYKNRRGSTTWEFYWGFDEDTDIWKNRKDVLVVKATEYKKMSF